MVAVLILSIWVLFGFIGYQLGKKKNIGRIGGMLFGLIGGVLGLIILFLLPIRKKRNLPFNRASFFNEGHPSQAVLQAIADIDRQIYETQELHTRKRLVEERAGKVEELAQLGNVEKAQEEKEKTNQLREALV